MPAIAPFSGFSEDTFDFLTGIAAHNDRDWFDAHRKHYKAHFVGAAQSFVVAMGERLQAMHPGILAEPKVNGSIFRLNRDTRFSKDKTPYKTHMDIMFHIGAGRSRDNPGFFFRMYPHSLHLGAGMHGFDPKKVLPAFREAVTGPKGAALETLLSDIAKLSDYEIGGAHYKRVPRGLDPEHPRAELLKHNALWAASTFEPLPKSASSAAFVDFCADHFEALLPLLLWVSDVVESTK